MPMPPNMPPAPGARPMMPPGGGGGMAPPGRPMPPPPGAPPPGGDPAASIKADLQAKIAALPVGKFSVRVLQKLADTLNDVLPKILGKDAPKGQVVLPPMEGPSFDGKLPEMLAIPAILLIAVAAQSNPDIRVDLSTITNDAAINELIAHLKLAASNPDVKKAAAGEPSKPEPKEAPEEEDDGDMPSEPPEAAKRYM